MQIQHRVAAREITRRCVVVTGVAIAAGALFSGAASAAPSEAAVRLAYIDPGAGSFILQAVVASIAGAAVAVSAYWQRIKRFLGIASDPDDDRETKPSRDD